MAFLRIGFMKLLTMLALVLWLDCGVEARGASGGFAGQDLPVARARASFGGGFGGVRRTAALPNDPFVQGSGGSHG